MGEYQSIVINLAEIGNNTMLDSAKLDCYTGLLGDKNFFKKLCFDINMPIADAFKLNLITNDLTLNNIGDEIDVSYALNFINNYQYAENQMYEASNGSWGLASEKTYTISFVTEYQTVPQNVVNAVNSEITLPILENFITDDGIAKTTYTFEGWYYSQDYSQKFELKIMPRNDIVLYAKWTLNTEYYRTITFVGGADGDFSIVKLEGEYFEMPNYTTKYENDGDVTTTYQFVCWKTSDGEIFNSNTIPTYDVIVYAEWEVVDVKITKQFSLYDGEELIYSSRIVSGEIIELPKQEKINDTTKFYLDNLYMYEYEIDVMPDENLTLFVRNRYTLKIISNYGNIINEELILYQGESYSLVNQASYTFDDGNTRSDYVFNSYTSSDEITYIMPNCNLEIVADWTIITRQYFTVYFRTDWYIPVGWISEGIEVTAPNQISPVKVLQGENLDLTQYVSTTQRKYTRVSKTHTWKTESWGLEPFDDISTKKGITMLTNIQNDVTLYACWYKQ